MPANHTSSSATETMHAHPFVVAYVRHLKGKRYEPGTLDKRLYAVRCLFSWIELQSVPPELQDITAADMEKYQVYTRKRGIAGSTADALIADAKKFFQFLESSGRVFLNPMERTVINWTPRRIKHVPSEADMRKLLAAVDTTAPNGIRDRALLEVMYSTGARLGEVLRMTIFDPDAERGTVRVFGKGKKERMLPLGKHAVLWLKQYLKATRPKLQGDRIEVTALWIGKTGAPLKQSRVDQIVKAAVDAAGLTRSISSHAIRRACATHMLRGGAHPVQIQMLLGHSNLNSLSQYLQVTISDLHKMHAASKPGR
ncbi:MAG: tyrosine-type recombinase/integrase [Verrucomicrobia bacterium]|nr:tyrosine-type recombinase/integrase [Verrucomicrobiota bacterium]